MSPRWGSTPRQTDWLTVSRNVTPDFDSDSNLQVGRISNLRQWNVVMTPEELGHKNDREGEAQQFSRQRGCYISTITASVHLDNKITGREFQWACRQDEPIGG
jgi:hypothetical protein